MVLAIGGSGRGAGKTAVGCGLIAALSEFRWTAVKVTPHAHGLPLELVEETDRDSDKDTGRCLAAGARRAFLMTVDEHWSGERLPGLDSAMREALDSGALLVESNRFALTEWSQRVVKLAVIGAPEAEWKDSLRAFVPVADALVLTGGMEQRDLPMEWRERHIFVLPQGIWISAAITEFVRLRWARLDEQFALK